MDKTDKKFKEMLKSKIVRKYINRKKLNRYYSFLYFENSSSRVFQHHYSVIEFYKIINSVKKLSTLERFIIYLKYWKDLDYEDISSIMYLNVFNIKMIEKRALTHLKDFFVKDKTSYKGYEERAM